MAITLSPYNPQWPDQYAHERLRLLAALGEVTAGGLIEQMQHIGASAVPGLLARPCIDIALAVWPFPLTDAHLAALSGLGYAFAPGFIATPISTSEQRLLHASGGFQLFVVAAGSDQWSDYVHLRDYLRYDERARREYATARNKWAASTSAEGYAENKAQLFAHLLPKANAWWIAEQGFAPIQRAAQELQGFALPWHVSSGWALDLFLGHVTRVHHDIDIVIAHEHQLALQQYMLARGWAFVTPLKGHLEPWPPHMRLELPRHQVHAHRGDEMMDFLFTDMLNGVWHYRREPSIVQSVQRASLCSAEGINYLAPELVLLFKSKNTGNSQRSKDQHDFEAVLPHLDAAQRAWLRWALLVTQPAHAWIARLA
jgi:GrpB-like predicted nucleotidyltransferase (UPF0157 family)